MVDHKLMLPDLEKPPKPFSTQAIIKDLLAGVVVFLVALPLCLGIAKASGAPEISGIISGIVGGLLVGFISKSHTSVSGPAAGLTAIVAAEITRLGSFEAFLCAVMIGGVIQIVMGIVRAGFLSEFFPNSVIKGLLTAIGVILILKQVPHFFGHDSDPEGEMSFRQPDAETTFSELFEIMPDFHMGPAIIGMICLALMIVWEYVKVLKKSPVPVAVVVVALGILLDYLFDSLGGKWAVESSHQVTIPASNYLTFPAWATFLRPEVYLAGATIAIVASLETLLNIEAVDRLDPKRRVTPTSWELFAQGVGNLTCGLIGGLPVTSVIVRSSVNINAGSQTKLSGIFHGLLLLVCVVFVSSVLNRIPLSALAAILLMTGYKLAHPKQIKEMWQRGWVNFAPYVITVLAIVFTDLLIGIIIGLVTSILFILNSNLKSPVRRIVEHHLSGDVLRIELASQITFLNKARMASVLQNVPNGGHVLIDARNTVFIDPDVLELIADYRNEFAPVHNIKVSLMGFRKKYLLDDEIQYVEFATRDLQEKMTPAAVLEMLKAGNKRFLEGRPLTRNLGRQKDGTAQAQFPMAAVLSCIDSRTPSEIVFDLGLGDVFSVRIAGNVISERVLGSLEYASKVAGAKLVVVMGHSRCGAVNAAVSLLTSDKTAEQVTGCQHLQILADDIQRVVPDDMRHKISRMSAAEIAAYSDEVAQANVKAVIERILETSYTIRLLLEEGKIGIVGAFYDVTSGEIRFLELIGFEPADEPSAHVSTAT